MRFRRADGSSTLRKGARPAAARFALARSVDGTAPYLALGAPLLGIVVVLVSRLILPG